MPIVILAAALAAYVYALLAAPSLRAPGLAIGAVALVGLGLYFGTASPLADRAAARIGADDLTLDQVAMEPIGRGATLTGRVFNRSPDWRLREMTLRLRLRDCPLAQEDVAACPVIGEATATARPDAPPGQIRAFETLFAFPNLPQATGALRWDWSVLSTRATD